MYIGDIFGISHDSITLLESIKNKERVKYKKDKIAEPETCL